MADEFAVFSDYHQIHVLDREFEGAVEDYWSRLDNPLHHHLALAENGLAIGTGINGYVTVVVEVTDGRPADDRDAFPHVLECSVRFDSGEVVLTSPTTWKDDGDRVAVPPGYLRVRISQSTDPWADEEFADEETEDDPARRPRVRIQCWSAPPTDPTVIRGWDPTAERRVL